MNWQREFEKNNLFTIRISENEKYYQGPSASLFSEQLSRFYLITFACCAKVISVPVCLDFLIVPFCHHKFEHHFIASIFFIYRRTLCYRAIQKNVQHKGLEFFKLARLARWLNIFKLVRGLFQSDPISIMRACL